MSLSLPSSSNGSLLPVAGHQIPGQTFIFCNGIMNDRETAFSSAKKLSSTLGNREVFLYHNPTTLSNYFDSEKEEFERQTELAHSLGRQIHQSILASEAKGVARKDICVTLFVHSHGAVVAKRALEYLEQLDDTAKHNVRVYAFGGATLIPNRLARQVHNYILDRDLISKVGNAREKESIAFGQARKIKALMKTGGLDLQTAIEKQAHFDLFVSLSPLFRKRALEDPKMGAAKDERYREIFEKNQKSALLSDPEYRANVKAYRALFDAYQITIIDGPRLRNPKFDPLPPSGNGGLWGKLKVVAKNIAKGLFALGSNAMENHTFETYIHCIIRAGHVPVC